MGRKLILTGTKLSDLTAPRLLRVDPIESAGSLLLIDPTHPIGAWDAGNPANGATVDNLMSGFATSVTGFSESALEATALVPSTFSGTAGKLERTGRGGLHGIHSQTAGVHASGPVIAYPTSLVEYVMRNRAHTFYTSMWFRPTRFPVAGYNSSGIHCFNGNGQQTNSYLSVIGFNAADNTGGGWVYRGQSGIRTLPQPPHQADAPMLATINSTGWHSEGTATSLPGDGTNTTVTGTRGGAGVAFGSTVAWPGVSAGDWSVGDGYFTHASTSTIPNNAGSFVFYRSYMEDLTVSGRTWEQVNAIDRDLYTREVLTEGGRYYGDTYTAPSTLP